ncbi:MAG: amidohydrolase [Planctomycetota bacterium]|jgi:predicted amidohydrolase YtcJ
MSAPGPRPTFSRGEARDKMRRVHAVPPPRRVAPSVALVVLVLLASASACGSAERLPPPRPASPATQPPVADTRCDLLLRGGIVHTLDEARPRAEALASRGGRIVFVGSDAEAAPWAEAATAVLDLDGRHVYPGFADAHLHLAGYGRMLQKVDLIGTTSFAEVVARVAAQAAHQPPGTWVLGRGWDQNDWERAEFPSHAPLSEAVPGHPVLLERVDGHAVLANAAAMAAAGLDAGTPTPDGSRILRVAAGAPTGVLVDNATAIVERVVPEPGDEQIRDGLRRAVAVLHRHGLTAVHDPGVSLQTARLYGEMARAGELPLRLHVMLSEDEPALWSGAPDLPTADLTGQGLVSVRGVKAYADGALGSRGAALLDDYSDEPGHRGLVVTPRARLAVIAEHCLRAGWQLAIHAIGDEGNRTALDVCEAAFAAVPPAERPSGGTDPRFRIEHCQVIAPEDIPRFAALGVIPSMQAQHQTSDMPWAEARLGPERVLGSYAWRALLDTGARIPGGSDAPVERVDPLAAFHAAVTRQDERGEPPGGWYPEQAMTRSEALRHMTLWPAYAAFEEGRLGSLEPGKCADLVVLDTDLETSPAQRLPEAKVLLTVIDGVIVYRSGADGPAPTPDADGSR